MSQSEASFFAKRGSFASSSAWKRRFSSCSGWPDSRLSAISLATTPIQSGEKATFSSSPRMWSSRVRRWSTRGRRLIDATGLPLGRPRCEQRMTLALWRKAYSMVGRVSRMRVSSVMMPSLSGTLKSTRMRTRLSVRSRSRIDSLAMSVRGYPRRRREASIGQRYGQADQKNHSGDIIEPYHGSGVDPGVNVGVRKHQVIHDDVDERPVNQTGGDRVALKT